MNSDGPVQEILEDVWCQAIDAATSPDFRSSDGTLNELLFSMYKRNVTVRAEALLEQIQEAIEW